MPSRTTTTPKTKRPSTTKPTPRPAPLTSAGPSTYTPEPANLAAMLQAIATEAHAHRLDAARRDLREIGGGIVSACTYGGSAEARLEATKARLAAAHVELLASTIVGEDARDRTVCVVVRLPATYAAADLAALCHAATLDAVKREPPPSQAAAPSSAPFYAALAFALGAEHYDVLEPTAAGLAIGSLDAIADELDLLWMAMHDSSSRAEEFANDVHRILRRAQTARDMADQMRAEGKGASHAA